ncbi:MAG: carnitine dehydratase [Gammaproteobacteria bacterium]|nr:carnitine dehydratase [Gammaproteobacteria bacterium]
MAPLEGIRVVELCQIAAGPFCGMLLADMGADVIKVESPGTGDGMRQWPPITDGYSENFASVNRNKRSVELNLKDPDDVARARALVRTADVVIENFRPGVLDRLGLGCADLKQVQPKLVFCSVSAYGQTGPRSRQGGFDLTMQAMAGVMSVTGEPDAPPVKCGVPISDFAAVLYAAYAVTASLRDVERHGRGVQIDIPMLGATLGIAALQTSEFFGNEKNPRPLGSAHPRNAPYQAFRCSDGYFAMAAGNDKLWASVCDVVERPELSKDTRFLSTADRAANQVELKDILEEVFVQSSAEEWLAKFNEAGVPCAPINQYSDALADPQVQHMGLVQPLTLPNGAQTRTVVSPILMDGASAGVRLPPPKLGEHNDEVFAELGETSAS